MAELGHSERPALLPIHLLIYLHRIANRLLPVQYAGQGGSLCLLAELGH